VFNAHKSSNKRLHRRRNFLSKSAAVGGIAMLGASAGPVQAARALDKFSPVRSPGGNSFISNGNARVDDFSGLLGESFSLLTEDGTATRAKLIEAITPKTRRAPRFRREHFSVVFDVPADVELVQGHYRISHPRLGTLDLFMVPVDLPQKFNRLEAVFT